MPPKPARRPLSLIREFIRGETAGGLVLMAAAAAALAVANSPLASVYFDALTIKLGPLSVKHWIDDGLMAIFFLLVGLEIKREALEGELAAWPQRALPGLAALGGMAAPAIIFATLNWHDPQTLRGWAIPTATDIAFALGVMALLGDRVPPALKVFLTALAIIDDLGAVLIIALFYTTGLNYGALAGAAAILLGLLAMNRLGVRKLWPYLVAGVSLWACVLGSGVHATIAGVLLALTIPLRAQARAATPEANAREADSTPPLLRLEHALQRAVPLIIVPLFGFANAGVSFAGASREVLLAPLTLGVAGGLLFGKAIGVSAACWLTMRLGLARMPDNARWIHLFGVALLCGVGFTMSLFIGLLAFANAPLLQEEVKLGIIMGSTIAALCGYAVLRLAPAPPA